MTSSIYDQECEDLAFECFATIRAAAMEAADKIASKRAYVNEQIEEALEIIFGESNVKTSAGGFALATLVVAGKTIEQIEQTLEAGQNELEEFLALTRVR